MITAAEAPGSGEWLGVDWGALAWVTVTALVATVVIVTFYSLGLRLLSVRAAEGGSEMAHRPPIATAGAAVCIAIGIAGVLYGIYLVIPLFH
jgi:hypothetical protein